MPIVFGSSNKTLQHQLLLSLESQIKVLSTKLSTFLDGERQIEILTTFEDEVIYVVQSTNKDCFIIELLLILDALKRGAAKKIITIIPYFGYSRQDRRVNTLAPVSAKLIANLLVKAGSDAVVTVDIHSEQIEGFFDIPFLSLSSLTLFSSFIKNSTETFSQENFIIVSPDLGGINRARNLSLSLGVDLAIIDKVRDKPGMSRALNVIGNVNSKTCIIIDDLVAGGGTLCNAATLLKDEGAKEVIGVITHGVLCGNAIEKIINSHISYLLITDSISPPSPLPTKIQVISLGTLIGEYINKQNNTILYGNKAF